MLSEKNTFVGVLGNRKWTKVKDQKISGRDCICHMMLKVISLHLQDQNLLFNGYKNRNGFNKESEDCPK